MMEGRTNKSNVVSMEEWKSKTLSKIKHVSTPEETRAVFREGIKGWISELELFVSEEKISLAKLKVVNNFYTNNTGKDLAKEDSMWMEQQEAMIKALQEHIAVGKFLLSNKDIGNDELLEYLEVDIDSLYPHNT